MKEADYTDDYAAMASTTGQDGETFYCTTYKSMFKWNNGAWWPEANGQILEHRSRLETRIGSLPAEPPRCWFLSAEEVEMKGLEILRCSVQPCLDDDICVIEKSVYDRERKGYEDHFQKWHKELTDATWEIAQLKTREPLNWLAEIPGSKVFYSPSIDQLTIGGDMDNDFCWREGFNDVEDWIKVGEL